MIKTAARLMSKGLGASRQKQANKQSRTEAHEKENTRESRMTSDLQQGKAQDIFKKNSSSVWQVKKMLFLKRSKVNG